jgi:U3 small nucleolar RNA-associated protein 10
MVLCRINEFNIPALVSLFLPYHTTAFFPSALALIAPTALGPSSPFSSLLPAKNSLAPVPLAALVALLPPFSSVASSHDLLKLIIEIPLSYFPSQVPHRALVGFWLQLFVAYLDRAGSEGLDQGQQGLVLSTIIAVIQQAKGADDILVASFILLTQFGKYYPFTTEELKVVMKVVVGHRNKHVAVMGEEEGDVVAEADKERAWLTTLVLLPSLAEEDMQVKEGKKFLGGAGWKALMNVE